MKTLFKNSLYSFQLLVGKPSIIFFDWTDKTTEMNYEDFQAACNNFAGFAWEYQSKHLLVDTCKFNFQLPEEFIIWREEELNPRYYKLGVYKFAYITKPEFLPFMKDIPAENGKFETRNFITFQEAINWLNN
jgi:hypothetical protein